MAEVVVGFKVLLPSLVVIHLHKFLFDGEVALDVIFQGPQNLPLELLVFAGIIETIDQGHQAFVLFVNDVDLSVPNRRSKG